MKKLRSIIINCVVTTVSLCAVSAFADTAKGNVNWNDGYVEAVGQGTAKSSGNKSKDKMRAIRAAEAGAHRALLEIIKGVHITSMTTVQDSMLTDDTIKTRVEGVVKGAYIVSDKFEWESDGSPAATVVMRICLMSGTSCKGTSLVQALDLEKIPEPQFVPQKNIILDAPQQDVAPPPKPVADVPKLVIIPPRSTHSCDLTKAVTGIIFSLDGKNFERVLMPVVISEAVSEEPVKVYSAKLVKPSVFRTFGAIRYADSIDNAVKQTHVCGNVLVVPVKEITRENMMVIDARDAATIKETLSHGNNYLEDAKVVISAQ
jgi:hypothetical protein